MSGKAIDGQRQHADVDERDGQAAERRRDGPAAQAVPRLRDQQDSQQVAQAEPQDWPSVKLWVRSTSTVPSTQLLMAATGRMRRSWPLRGPLTARSTRCSKMQTTATQAT